ncbi:MAG: hydrogenase maturation nickel metallochaperone HypA [Saprospiraceae bacterium]|nr:hydrogenase maturation nickel metallochaperone HypA [Saprospiraceae bacterium]
MHELSIVLNILEIAEHQLKEHAGNKVDAIELEIGTMAGIEMDAFHFAWDAALPGSVLERCKLTIHSVDAKALCSECGYMYRMLEHYMACPACGSFRNSMIQGKELKVNSLEII